MDALQSYELSDVNTPVGSPGKESGVITMSNTDYFVEKGKPHPLDPPSIKVTGVSLRRGGNHTQHRSG